MAAICATPAAPRSASSGCVPDGTIVPRNNFVGDPIHRVDMRVQKRISLGGGRSLAGFLEVFNVFNHENYGSYTTQESSASYGLPSFNSNLAYQARMLQLGFRVGLVMPSRHGQERCNIMMRVHGASCWLSSLLQHVDGAARRRPDVYVPSRPETIAWGAFPIDKPAVVTVKSGQTVRIDTLSHAGSTQDEHPVAFLGEVRRQAGRDPERRAGLLGRAARRCGRPATAAGTC